ncbi:MAG: CpXC domain-containing protein [Kofleriaceae bacterium]
MSIVGTVAVQCRGCGTSHDARLVQSINARKDPEAKQRLVAGELNVVACSCGMRTQLAATLLFHDPDADYYCQVCPGGEDAMAEAEVAFRAAGATGVQRLVPSQNALVEKIKLLDAGLEDWAIEMTKVLLLASIEPLDLDRVLLFDRVDREAEVIHWLLFPIGSLEPQRVASPLGAYQRIAERPRSRPAADALRIDRAWAVTAVREMIADGN